MCGRAHVCTRILAIFGSVSPLDLGLTAKSRSGLGPNSRIRLRQPSINTNSPYLSVSMHHCTAVHCTLCCMNAPFTSALLTLSIAKARVALSFRCLQPLTASQCRPDPSYLLLRLIILPRSVFPFSPVHLHRASVTAQSALSLLITSPTLK